MNTPINTSPLPTQENKGSPKIPKVVIVGAGFGGVYTAQALLPLLRRGEITITIVNETNYFLFTPLLHEVATGSLSPQSAAESLREMFAGEMVTVVQGTVASIDQKEKVVRMCELKDCTDGLNPVPGRAIIPEMQICPPHIPFDFLVIATGATTNYFGNKSAETHSLPLKNLADALRIKDRVIQCFEEMTCSSSGGDGGGANSAADNAADGSAQSCVITSKNNTLSFVVIGGGPTGVETVAELSEFVFGMAKRYMHVQTKPEITLISAGKSILEQFHPSLREKALKRLEKKGIRILLESVAQEITPDKVVLANGQEIGASTVIWVAGVRPQAPTFVDAVAVNKGGRLIIDPYFRLVDHENIFALGDVATLADKPLPMLAQVAVGQAHTVAHNISTMVRGRADEGSLRDFTYRSKGSLVSIGQRFAVGELHRLRISGMITWWLWRTVYLFKFVSWQKRFRIMFEWTLALFAPRDTTKAM